MTLNNLQFADHICQLMLANSMVRSQAEFSKDWLNHSASYLSSSKSRSRHLSDEAIHFLFERLTLRLQSYQGQANALIGIKFWREAYEQLTLIYVQVQNYLTWQASQVEASAFPPGRIEVLRQKSLSSEAKSPSTASEAQGRSIVANLIQLVRKGGSQ